MKLRSLVFSLSLAAVAMTTSRAAAHDLTFQERIAARRAQQLSWYAPYYHVNYCAPVALVVPPTAELQVNYHWGVGGTRVAPIYHQYGRNYPGMATGGYGGAMYPTPIWPSDTNQFGVYYIRGPW